MWYDFVLAHPWGVVAAILGFVSYAAYYRGIFTGQVHPHLFTWVTWGATTLIASVGQYTGGAGAGAWSTYITTIMTMGVILASLKVGERQITRSDWFSLILGFIAVVLWIFTQSALWSMVLVTVIDVMGSFPTFRKSWKKPRQESLANFGLGTIKHFCALQAMAQISLVTCLYPTALMIMNFSLFAFIGIRRLVLQRAHKKASTQEA